MPKLTNDSNELILEIITPCVTAFKSNVTIHCPALLRSFIGSTEEADPYVRCELIPDKTYYVAPVNGVAPYVGLYDWVFTDAYGQNKLADGFYKTNFVPLPNDTIQVQNGIVIDIIETC